MAIKQVIASKWCLMIRPYELDNTFLSIQGYHSNIEPKGSALNVGYCNKTIYSNVITSDISNGIYKLSQYFTNKKVFKIIDINIEAREITHDTYTTKIYYLEKK